jgi:hypothetical protein
MKTVAATLALMVGVFLTPGHAHADSTLAAQVELAQRYEHGEGLALDAQRARELYCTAAEAGSADAAFQLGWTYFLGRGVERDDRVAARWFLLAVKRGHLQAQNVIERFHLAGDAGAPTCRTEPPAKLAVPMLPPAQIAQMVARLAPRHGLDPGLVLAVIKVESGFQPGAVSPKNARGLMQLIPETAARFGVTDPFAVEENLQGGMRYLRWLLSYFRGNVTLALAAYNAGEGRVDDYHGVPPFPETRDYVQRVHLYYPALTHPFDPHIVAASPFIVVH